MKHSIICCWCANTLGVYAREGVDIPAIICNDCMHSIREDAKEAIKSEYKSRWDFDD